MRFKKTLFYFFLGVSTVIFGQKKVVQKIQSEAASIEITTRGIDHLMIENSVTDFIEIYLYAENVDQQHILTKEKYGNLEIAFQIPEIPKEIPVFRKFITQRLERATAIIKIPNAKKCIVFGEDVQITAKNYKGPFDITIQKGVLKLYKAQNTTEIKMHTGSVFATLKDINIAVSTKKGLVSVDKKIQTNKSYQKQVPNLHKFSISAVKANIYLTTLKPQ